MTEATPSTRIAERYYDSADADRFYHQIWGGEDIHVGLYDDETTSIREASRRTVEAMARRLRLGPHTRVLDLGSGYGGAARWLARAYGCPVTCLNLSETQNQRNRAMNRELGLDDRIEVVHGNFEALPFADGAFAHAWCQDSILHSSARAQVLAEVARVLVPGGEFVFTDPMQDPGAPADALGPLLERIHLSSLASFEFYRRTAGEVGLEVVDIEDRTPQLATHYARVRQELLARRRELEGSVSGEYLDRMLLGLQRWAEAGQRGHLAWGILHLRKPR